MMRARKPIGRLLAMVGVLAGALLLPGTVLAAAPEAPVTSSPAESIAATTAIMEGTLNPHSTAKVGWYFAYGTGAECGGAFTFTSASEEVEGKALLENPEVTGLEPDREYKFCLVATNALGQFTRGNEVSFQTLAAPPSLTEGSESASPVSPFEESLGAVLNANNQETTYALEYATAATGEKLAGTIVKVNGESPLEGFGEQSIRVATGRVLKPATTYYYRVIAEDEQSRTEGKPTAGKVEQFTTATAQPPVVEAESFSGLAATAAKLQATIDPNEQRTTYAFEYSTQEAGGVLEGAIVKVPGASALEGAGGQPVSVSTGVLEPDTTYFYRAVAENEASKQAGQAAAGAVKSFTTPPTAASANTEGVSEVTFDTATLNGTVIPGGVEAGSDTRWCFEYGTGASGEYNLGSQPLLPGDAGRGTSAVPVSVHLGDLQPGSTYRYRLVAVNALGMGFGSTACGTEGGQETDGAEALFTTPIDLPPPVAVTGVASGVSQNTATISGTVDPEGLQTSYEFQLGLDTSYGAQVFGEAGAGSEPELYTLNLQDLQPDTTYHYRVVAISQGGTSYGADASFTTGGFPTAALSAPASAPLLATPTFAFPTNTTETAATKTTKVKKAKKRSTKKKRSKVGKGKKATRASRRRTGKRRDGQ